MLLSHTIKNCLLSTLFVVPAAVISAQDFARAQPITTSIPTKIVIVNGKKVRAPDFDKITFESLPPTTSAGSLRVTQKVVDYLGFDPSTSWVAGQKPETFLKLGSLSGFEIQKMTLQDVAKLTAINPSTLNLKQFQLMQWQSAQSLLEAIPDLSDTPLQDVPPLADLFDKYGIVDQPQSNSQIKNYKLESAISLNNLTVGDAVRIAPEVAAKLLGKELNLRIYKVSDVPRLEKTPIQNFKGWQVSTISGVPDLAKVHWNDFPTPPPGVIRAIAPIDFGWSKQEMVSLDAIPHVISGSVEPRGGLYTIPVPPTIGKKIPYVELADYLGPQGPSYGSRWYAGTQQVSGGYGELKAVNAGKEPTGLATYAPLFKVSLDKTDETTGQATFNISFRYCMKTAFVDFGCTPYCFEFPWIPARETEAVVVTASYESRKPLW